jgi:hypothetical protein
VFVGGALSAIEGSSSIEKEKRVEKREKRQIVFGLWVLGLWSNYYKVKKVLSF